MARIDRMIRGAAAFVVALGLGGCLSAPIGLDCGEAPPGTAGCPADPPDGATDRGAPAVDTGPTDGGPAAEPDRSPPDGWPEDAASPDARPADAAHDGGLESVCADAPCPAPPIEVACLDDLGVAIGDPICAPIACGDDPGCDPEAVECRGFVGCVLWCLLVEGRDDCDETCAGPDPSDALMARFGALAACLEGADCVDGPSGADCQAEACGAEIEQCVGDIGRIWFVRPPGAGDAVGCDYPFETRDDCGARDLRCRRGECVDAGGPCQPDPCMVRPELRCDGVDIVQVSPPVCAADGDEAVCTYDEEYSPCEASPLRCEGDVLIEGRDPGCVEDEQGVYCTQEQTETACDAERPANCDGNTAVTQDIGRCGEVGGAAACVPGGQRRTPCDADSLCHDGACTPSACGVVCEARNMRGCDRGQAPLYVACGRDRICEGGACRGMPAIYQSFCRTADDVSACALSGLTCRGLAAVPQCLFGDAPRAPEETCWTTVDCEPGLLCTRYGVCSPGAEGSACESRLDCQPDSACLRGTCR